MSYQRSQQPDEDSFHEHQADYDSHAYTFQNATTAETKKRNQELYPRKGDPKALQDYLRTERTAQYTNNEKFISGEPERKKVTQDNARAVSDVRKQKNIKTEDFAYAEGNPLRDGYKTAKNTRDNPLTGRGPGNDNFVDNFNRR
ncbi:hypothetical protein H2200_001303 [Cladophialophora chaetospira]|uniref:Uncharacterized protein n=1 Tax=Cladophialophora chaetospira TaxID=386627 RepID=A0AA38XKM7_9EURO|nr:hypothetical protein H2200_001303 [Cladophialophora chaetospira]